MKRLTAVIGRKAVKTPSQNQVQHQIRRWWIWWSESSCEMQSSGTPLFWEYSHFSFWDIFVYYHTRRVCKRDEKRESKGIQS